MAFNVQYQLRLNDFYTMPHISCRQRHVLYVHFNIDSYRDL